MPTDRASLIVTTSHKARAETIALAASRAAVWSLPFIPRDETPIESMLDGDGAALVFTNAGVHVATRDGRLAYHLGTAFIRLKSVERGDGDPLIRIAELRAGDRVLDTTFGLGRDATVASRIVGTSGRVVALESSLALYHLAKETLSAQCPDESSAAIELHLGDAREHLRNADTNSVDVVLVDPMFSEPKTSDPGFTLLRSVADPTPLDRMWVSEARRVARRWVVVKAGASQPWFDEEELLHIRGHSNAAWFRSPPSMS